MVRRIMTLVRKDFRFNWKLALGVIAFVAASFAGMWLEFKIGHIWEDAEDGGFLTCWVVAALGIIPINYSFRREQGASTKLFLSSLPVRSSELFIANIVTAMIYMALLAAILLLEFWVFGIPYGVKYIFAALPIGFCFSAVYICLYYVFSFNVAQTFFLGSMMATVIAVRWIGVDFESMAFFANPHITVAVCVTMVILAICTIAILCKQKKSIL